MSEKKRPEIIGMDISSGDDKSCVVYGRHSENMVIVEEIVFISEGMSEAVDRALPLALEHLQRKIEEATSLPKGFFSEKEPRTVSGIIENYKYTGGMS